MLATSFAEAAGVAGRQKWGLVLSSSARVSQVTYQTVVGVRYPELVTFNGTSWNFGKFVTEERPRRGGFLPVFWDVPRADMHAVEDIGAVVDWLTERCEFRADAKSSLAVLHNRNDMTNLFRASNWVSGSHDTIVSRGVTTCAGMTAHTVILAQTRVSFLTGGRKKAFLALPEDEQMVQLEEAYARATVAVTRARALCLLMGPLDMKGLLGAATVMGTLMYGAGHVWAGRAHFYLHDHEISQSPPDESFIDMLKQSCQFWKCYRTMSPTTIRYGDYILLWWTCGGHGSTILPGPNKSLISCGTFGIGLNEDELLPDLHITGAGVLRARLGDHQEHRVNQEAQAADRTKVPAEVIQVAPHEVDQDSVKDESIGDASGSEGSESARESEQNDPPSSLAADAEQYERMQASYAEVGCDFNEQEDLLGSEYRKLQRLEMVPQRWPLARLSFSLQKCVDHLDRVLAGCCWEVYATRTNPEKSVSSLRQVSKSLTMLLADLLGQRGGCHPSGDLNASYQETL